MCSFVQLIVILGKITENESAVRFILNLNCINCGKKVPGGMLAAEKYFGTYSFFLEIDDFKKKYLCGICRDKQRTGKINR